MAKFRTISSKPEDIDALVIEYASSGFQIVSRTESQLQMVRKKRFGFFWALLWLLFGIVPLLLYILYFLAKRDDITTVTISGEQVLKAA